MEGRPTGRRVVWVAVATIWMMSTLPTLAWAAVEQVPAATETSAPVVQGSSLGTVVWTLTGVLALAVGWVVSRRRSVAVDGVVRDSVPAMAGQAA